MNSMQACLQGDIGSVDACYCLDKSLLLLYACGKQCFTNKGLSINYRDLVLM